MNGERIDPNVLAAFLEDRLTPAERERVLEQLHRSPADYEAFVEAAEALHDLEAETTGDVRPAETGAPPASPTTPTFPLESRRARRRWSPAWAALPLAAVLAGVLLLRPLIGGRTDPQSLLALADPVALVAGSGPGAVTDQLGEAWAAPGWGVMRGEDAPRAEHAAEFRVGSRLAAARLALARLDTAAARPLAAELAALLGSVPGSEPVRASWQQVARHETDGEAAIGELTALLGDSPWLQLGVWIEQARLAVLAGHTGYFDAPARRALQRLHRQLGGTPAAGAVGAVLAREWPPADAGTLAALRAPITDVIRAAGD